MNNNRFSHPQYISKTFSAVFFAQVFHGLKPQGLRVRITLEV